MNVKEQLLESMGVQKDQWPLYDDTESENGQPIISNVPSIPPIGIPEPDNPLAAANIPEAWWPDCYITDYGQIFTPRFDRDGTMTATGEQAYHEWLAACDAPPVPPEPDPQAVLGAQVAGLTLSNSVHDDMISVLGAQVAQLTLKMGGGEKA